MEIRELLHFVLKTSLDSLSLQLYYPLIIGIVNYLYTGKL